MNNPLPPINIKKFKRHKPKGCRKADPLEATIERQVCAHAKSKGIPSRKFVTPNRRSAPDRIFLPGKGQCFFIEFKRLGKKPTEGQYREHTRLREDGYEVYVVDNITDGVKVINTWLALNR